MVKSLSPDTLTAALEFRRDHGALPFAGGTDLMVARRCGLGLAPRFDAPVLFLGGVPDCRGITRLDGHLRIGATTTLTELLEDERVPVLLKQSAALMASPSIRNMATLGGNVGNASPAGDTLPPLYVADARIVLSRLEVDGPVEREMPLAEFITGPGTTQIRDDEIITAILLADCAPTATWYRKVATRKAAALSKTSLAALAVVRDGILKELRLAVGAAAPTVIRSRELEGLAAGVPRSNIETEIPRILEGYEQLLAPIDDQRSTAAYRRDVALRLIKRFLSVEAWRPDGEG